MCKGIENIGEIVGFSWLAGIGVMVGLLGLRQLLTIGIWANQRLLRVVSKPLAQIYRARKLGLTTGGKHDASSSR